MKNRFLARAGKTARMALVLGALLAFAGVSRASVRWATLEAIHQLENPRNSPKPGPFGELGAYQFRASTWKMHTKTPFQRAVDREVSDVVAVQHYEWLKRGLEQARMSASPYNIALAWNSGLNAVIAGSSPRVSHDYASRVVNLVSVYQGQANGPRYVSAR